MNTPKTTGAIAPASTSAARLVRTVPTMNGGSVNVQRYPGRPATLTIENARGKTLGVAVLPTISLDELVAALREATA